MNVRTATASVLTAAAICSIVLPSVAFAGIPAAPAEVRKTTEARLQEAPKVARTGGTVKISFTVTAATDVEVAILNAKGRVVRHLGAGLLGKNAPEPFKKDSLSQTLDWDLRDDAGRPAIGDPFKVRVRAGS